MTGGPIVTERDVECVFCGTWGVACPTYEDATRSTQERPLGCPWLTPQDRCAATAARPADPEVEKLRAELAEERQDRIDDLGRLLRALGLSDHARSISPAEVFDLCLCGIEGLRNRIPDAEADALRLHREKVEWMDRAIAAEARIVALEAEAARVRRFVLEEAAAAVERHDRVGREWIKGSLWDALAREAGARIRALAELKTQGGEHGR